MYSHEDLVMSVFNLFGAGTVTTSNTLVFFLLMLAKHPHIQGQAENTAAPVPGVLTGCQLWWVLFGGRPKSSCGVTQGWQLLDTDSHRPGDPDASPWAPSLPVQMAPDWPVGDILSWPDAGRDEGRDSVSGSIWD